MGGNAFNKSLSPSAFPRMLPPVYHALKSRLTPVLESLFVFVETPHETPEKLNHGDLDFTVAVPRVPVVQNDAGDVNVPHEVIKTALGAEYFVPFPGNRTSNYAVPILRSEWEKHGFGELFDEHLSEIDEVNPKLFYQVDVHVANDENEARRVVFFNSYGDLGMIMGLLATNNGLRLTHHGLKMPNGIWKPVLLSEDMNEVMEFMGLDHSVRSRGFQTKLQIFEWVGRSRFFDPRQFRSKGDGISTVKEVRKMYGEFVKWAEEQRRAAGVDDTEIDRDKLQIEWVDLKEKRKQEALIRFGKKEEHDEEMRIIELRAKLKANFSGHLVKQWANLGNRWEVVRMVMHIAKRNMGGDEGIGKVIDEEGEEGVKRYVQDALPEAEQEVRKKELKQL